MKGKGTYVKGSSVYWENMVTRMLLQISALVMSVAVMSMKTLRVFRLIFEWFELMMGGIEQTVRFLSSMIGYTGESLIMCRYRERCLSPCTENC